MWCFFQLEKIDPEPWEIDLIKKFDSMAMANFSKSAEEEQKKAKNPKSKG